MKKTFFNLQTAPLILICVLSLVSCSNSGYDQTKAGALYKIHTSGNTKKAKIGDYVEMNFVVKTVKDYVIISTYKTKRPAKFMVQKGRSISDLMDVIQLLAEHDSATVRIPTDSIFDPRKGMMRPPYIKPKSYLVFELKIEKVMNEKEFQEEQQKDQAKANADKLILKAAEGPAIAKYLADNHLKTDSTKSGVLYILKQAGTGASPKNGDTVYVKYTGKLLNGKIFDTNDTLVAKANKLYSVERKMQGGYAPFHYPLGQSAVIQGWDDFFLGVSKKGTIATIIIPSKLAYKGMDDPRGTIPAYSPLIFDVQLVDFKKGKPAPKMLPPSEIKAMQTHK